MDESRRNDPRIQSPRPARRLQACERCWKRKQKCDKLLPVCTTCHEARATCCPRTVPFGSATDEESGLSNTALPDYIETLKRKAEQLDDQSRRQRACPATDERVVTPHSTHLPADESSQISHTTPLTETTSITEGSVQAAMGEIGFLSRDAMAEPHDEARGFPQELAMASMIKASLAISGDNPARSSRPLSHKSTYRDMLNQTPALTRDFMAGCLRRFLDRTSFFSPYIDEAEMAVCCNSLFESDESFHSHGPPHAFRSFTAYMIAAIGALLSPDSGVEMFSTSLHNAAMVRFPEILEVNDVVNLLRSILLLIIYSMFTSTGGSTWHLVGIAVKKAVSYRFHKVPPHDNGVSEDILNKRRGIFWNLYIIDRMIGCALDRPFSIQDEDISLSIPPSSMRTQGQTGTDIAAQILMHAKILSNMELSTSQGMAFHYGSILYWRDMTRNIRDPYKSLSASRGVLQLTCRAFVRLVQVSRLKPPTTGGLGITRTIPQDVIAICVEYINAEYIALENGNFSGSFIDAFDIFSAGVVFIQAKRYSRSTSSSDSGVLNKCTALLTILGERFPALRRLCQTLWCLQESVDNPMIDQVGSIVPHSIQAIIKDGILDRPTPD
ncbi:Zn(II)2Cys6 transcription factor [Aspergillus ambiguus]|uniref:Zn(II)2Cys6 transcription factor n=1 Tax=Aspergillus ambiguus TaxID=176160 RepID=UPI003CCCDC00